MRKRLVLLALLLGVAVWQAPTGHASCVMGNGTSYAFEAITVSSASIGFSTGLIDQAAGQASSALVVIETNAIRFRGDGVAPTATVGIPIAAAGSFEVCGFGNIKALRMIRQSADATASVQYFR